MPRQACTRSKTWEAELGRPGRPGRTPRSAGPGAGGTHLSGSAAQSDLLPTFAQPAQPAQPAHALVVLAPPKPDPDLLSLFPPAALCQCLPACCLCCPVLLPTPAASPSPGSCLQPQQNSQSPSELTTSSPTSRTTLRTQFSGHLAYTHTRAHAYHNRPRRPRRPHPLLPRPDKPSSHSQHPAPDATAPLDLLACPRYSTVNPPAR